MSPPKYMYAQLPIAYLSHFHPDIMNKKRGRLIRNAKIALRSFDAHFLEHSDQNVSPKITWRGLRLSEQLHGVCI